MSNQKNVHLKQEINASIISLSGYGSYSDNNNDSQSHSSSTGCVPTKMPIVDKDHDDHRPTNQYVLVSAVYAVHYILNTCIAYSTCTGYLDLALQGLDCFDLSTYV